jgi:sortase B
VKKQTGILLAAAMLACWGGLTAFLQRADLAEDAEAYRKLDTYLSGEEAAASGSGGRTALKTEGSGSAAAALPEAAGTDSTYRDKPSEKTAAEGIDYTALRSVNPDFAGVISIPALRLRYPMAFSADNKEYLSRSYDGSPSGAGCIFVDCRADRSLSDRNTMIYGHNMKDWSMFGSLKRFLQEEGLCASDPFIYIFTADGIRKYRIFSYYVADAGSTAYDAVDSDTAYDRYLQSARASSEYAEEEMDFGKRPKLLTLSTCYSAGHRYYFVVHAALIRQEKTAESSVPAAAQP